MPASFSLEPPAILDIEASGFGRDSYPIEIGYVLPDGTAWCTLIRPEPHWLHWDAAAEAVHAISRDVALQHGRAAAEVVNILNERLRGLTVYSDGWAHDYAWLGRLYEAAGRSPSFRLEHLRRLFSDDEALRWHALHREVREEIGLQRHRASTDARVMQLAVARLHLPG